MQRHAPFADDPRMREPTTTAGTPDEVTLLIQHGRDREAAELAARHLAATEDRPATGPEPRQGAVLDPQAQLAAIFPLLTALVRDLDAVQLDAPTPCAAYSVRGVLEHMVGGATAFAAAFRGDDPQAVAPPSGDAVTAFPAALADLEEAVASPGALERTIAAPFGEVPGETFARFVAMDGLVHGWDIATATGQPYEPPADVVAAVDAFTRHALTDELRDGDTFKAPVEVADDAPPLVRLVAFTGRRP